MEQVNIISFIHNNGLFFSLYNYFIIILLITSIIVLICLNKYFSKISKNIKNDMQAKIPWARDIIVRYELLLKRQQDLVNTATFLDNYYLERKRLLIYIINIIDNSDKIFLLLGLFGSFNIILQALINFNFEQIVSFQELYNQFGNILYNLKPALFILLLGIISAIIIKIMLKSINIKEKFNSIKKRLENYLENNVKYKYNRELKELELLEQLIKTVEHGFIRLEKALVNNSERTGQKIKAFPEYDAVRDYNQSLKDIAATQEEEC